MRQAQARASLRQALSIIRRALGGVDALRVDAETVALDSATVDVDVWRFEQCADAVRRILLMGGDAHLMRSLAAS
jgi:DNA-binding SARP family transcriptional activator